jgi:hypothetical protein
LLAWQKASRSSLSQLKLVAAAKAESREITVEMRRREDSIWIGSWSARLFSKKAGGGLVVYLGGMKGLEACRVFGGRDVECVRKG